MTAAEPLEEPFAALLGYAVAIVFHGNCDYFSRDIAVHRYVTTLRCSIDCIRH